MFIIDDLFFFPLKGVFYVAQKIAEHVEGEYYDRDNIHRELLQLRLLYEMDEIDEEEYEKRETGLLERLAQINQKKEEEEEEKEEEEEEDE